MSLRHTYRSLLRSPAFVVTVVATLAIGIGLNAAIFTVVDCVLLRPLGYRDANRIVGIGTRFNKENRATAGIGGDDYKDVAEQIHGLESTAFYNSGDDGISLEGSALYLPVASVSPRFGEVMGVEPLAGRLFQSSDADGREALVSSAFAREHFGSAAAAIGQVIHYEADVHPIVGVLPEGFSFPKKTQVWFERNRFPETPSRTSYSQRAVGKRRADVTPAQLASEFSSFSSRLQKTYPEDAEKTVEALPLQDTIVGSIRPVLNLLMGSVAVILLIVCANITHLQLVRATRELRAVTIRTALGASRSTLAARALAEAGVLAGLGTVMAVLLAIPALRLLVYFAPSELPRLADVRLNFHVFGFSFAVALIVMAVTAVLPVWRSWHVDPASALRQDATRGTEGRRSVRLREGLIVAEIALTLMLSVTAILLTRQLIVQSHQDLGFSPESLITLDSHFVGATPPFADPPADKSPAAISAFQAKQLAIAQTQMAHLGRTLESIANTPGVSSAAAMDGAPMGFGGTDVSYAVKGRQVFGGSFQNLPDADLRVVTPNLFSTMGMPLLRGRLLSGEDRFGSQPVLLINQTLARTIFPGVDPIGKQIMCGYDSLSDWWTIVGVVGDIRSDSPGTPPSPTFYVPVAQHAERASDMQLVVRTATPPAVLVETLRSNLQTSHPEIAIRATTMQENIGETQRSDNFRSLLFMSFAVVSILLAAIGMYGVTAFSVAQRNFEFGLRVALGANREQLLGMVLLHAMRAAGIGIVCGIALSFGLLRMLSSILGQLPAFDLLAYTSATVLVLLIAVCATLVPARRAASIDPMQALRTE